MPAVSLPNAQPSATQDRRPPITPTEEMKELVIYVTRKPI